MKPEAFIECSTIPVSLLNTALPQISLHDFVGVLKRQINTNSRANSKWRRSKTTPATGMRARRRPTCNLTTNEPDIQVFTAPMFAAIAA